MEKLIVATNNEHKLEEIRRMLEGEDFEVFSLKDMGIDVDIDENKTTFEENSMIKARSIHKLTGNYVLADDSGLEVDYLDKAPGVYSARFMGYDTSYEVKNQAIIDKLEGVPKKNRSARFVCVMSLITPSGREFVRRGTIEGYIGYELRGENGFGYDPIVYVDEFGKTTAELSMDEKNKISHRGEALRLIMDVLKSIK